MIDAQWVAARVAHVLDVASTCPPLGNPAWDALLAELGVSPLTPRERQEHFAAGPKRKTGAAPIEVRLALNAIHDHAQTAWRALDIGADERALAHKLSTFVEEAMREYLKLVTPQAPTTSSIFANARATTPNYSAMGVGAGMNQMKCVACGAPRKNESDALTCVYCGGKLA
jgi:hypothetical protein